MYKQKTLDDLFSPIETELNTTIQNLQTNLSSDNQALNQIINYAFATGGKHIRPAISLLSSKLFQQELTDRNFTIAQIAEIIHTATLLHDDVIDNARLRRGKDTINAVWGNKISVISGDFLLARASAMLASLNNIHIIEVFSNTLEEICKGEIQQSDLIFKTTISWDEYILKTNRKTAKLFSSAAQGGALICNAPVQQAAALRDYGTYFGLAFQIVDDILNFYTQDQVGKPSCLDLKSGIITAPVIYAMEENTQLIHLIQKQFEDEADLVLAVDLIKNSAGIEKSKDLAHSYINRAIKALDIFEETEVKASLIALAEYVIERKF
jgi:all-trans-nonaprenyl-diphosphate synthase